MLKKLCRKKNREKIGVDGSLLRLGISRTGLTWMQGVREKVL